jgi:hypothetical protein
VDTTNKDSKFVIDYPRLYNIVNHQSYGDEDFHSIVYSDITLYSLFKYCKAYYHKKIAIISPGGELYRH